MNRPAGQSEFEWAGLTPAPSATIRVPRVADRFDWDDLTFEIVDMDGNRVDKLLVTRRPPAVATASA